jgi:hypothetical protein
LINIFQLIIPNNQLSININYLINWWPTIVDRSTFATLRSQPFCSPWWRRSPYRDHGDPRGSSELWPGLVMTNSLLLKMAIEIVSFPMKNGDFPWLCESLPDGISKTKFYTDIEKTPFPYISYFSWRNKNNEFFARLILQKWSIAMEVSMRHIAKTGGCSMAIFDFSERGGFHCISLIFLDVYILIYIYISLYIYTVSIYLWFTDLLYIHIYSASFWHLNVVPQRVFPKGRLFDTGRLHRPVRPLPVLPPQGWNTIRWVYLFIIGYGYIWLYNIYKHHNYIFSGYIW